MKGAYLAIDPGASGGGRAGAVLGEWTETLPLASGECAGHAVTVLPRVADRGRRLFCPRTRVGLVDATG